MIRFASRAVLCALTAALLIPVTGCGDDDGPQRCDPAAPDCPEGQVCLQDDDSPQGGTCEDSCDPLAADACAPGLVCEQVEGGGSSCFDPVVMTGQVFDIEDEAGIPDALVLAADDTGATVTDVAITDAVGDYELTIPVTRDAAGAPTGGIFTLRVSAADYLPYPSGLRPAIPVDASQASTGDGQWSLSNPTTDVALIPLPPAEQGQGSLSGSVAGDFPAGTLVVAECADPPCPFAFADLSGDYTIFNVPAGSYTVAGYKAFLQLTPVDVTVGDGQDVTGVDLAESSEALGTVTGNINIVNPQQGEATSVVLVPESVFQQITDTFVRGEVPPGLRAPEPGTPPSITGAFTIEGVPLGDYVVLAGFENDYLVRDPDPGISGTQIVHISVDTSSGVDIDLPSSFKITGSLVMVGPGADAPEEVDASQISFVWEDDSSEDYYTLAVYDAFGTEVWFVPDVPRVTGAGNVEVDYDGPALEPGMYYQWRAESWRDTGPISSTEELRGVFYVPGVVN